MEMSPLNRIQFQHCIRKSYAPPTKIYCYSEAKQVSDHAATLTCVSGKSNTHQQLYSEAGHLMGVLNFAGHLMGVLNFAGHLMGVLNFGCPEFWRGRAFDGCPEFCPEFCC
jgi:hypothetical protein